jgi:hypothetical protein
MEDLELRDALREAFARDSEPSERVWRHLRKPEPRWLPSLAEISFATFAGLLALLLISLPRSEMNVRPVARHESPVEMTYLASTRMRTTLR